MKSSVIQLHATVADLLTFIFRLPADQRGELLGVARGCVQRQLDWTTLDAELLSEFKGILLMPVGVHANVGETIGGIQERCAPLHLQVPWLLSVDQCLALGRESPPVHVEPGLRDVQFGVVDRREQFQGQLKIWQRLMLAFKKSLVKGATVRDPRSGQERFYPAMYATPAAVALSRQGTQLISGNINVVNFDVSDSVNDS